MDAWFISLLDLGQYGIFLFVFLTCLVSALLSGLLGLEREMKGQPAGLRTHVIISVTCCLLMSISIFAIHIAVKDNPSFSGLYYDSSRIAAGILGGIGFMGAGAIVKNGFNIKGLTTAATLFFAAGIGMACGSGFVLEATGVTLLVLVLLSGLIYIERWLDEKSPFIVIHTKADEGIVQRIKCDASDYSLVMKEFLSEVLKDKEGKEYQCITIVLTFYSNAKNVRAFIERLRKDKDVMHVEMTRRKKYRNDDLY